VRDGYITIGKKGGSLLKKRARLMQNREKKKKGGLSGRGGKKKRGKGLSSTVFLDRGKGKKRDVPWAVGGKEKGERGQLRGKKKKKKIA